MADPIARAINTFAALKGMDQRQEQLDQAREDRLFSRDMMSRQEARADETFNMNKAANAKNSAWQEKERTHKLGEWREGAVEKARTRADDILYEFTSQMEANGVKDWGPGEVEGLMGRLEPVKGELRKKLADLYDPAKVEERSAATKNILGRLRNGDLAHDDTLKDANIAFAPELEARGQKYGAKKVEFSRLLPSPQGDGFMAELEITKPDGTTYRAPATENGGTAEDGDNAVKIFKMEDVAPYLVGQVLTYEGAKGYLKSRGKIKDKDREVMQVGSDDGGRELVYKDTGELVRKIHGPTADADGKGGKGGKNGKGGLAVDNDAYKLFDDQLNKQFLSEFQEFSGAEQAMANMPPEIRRDYDKAQRRGVQAGEQFLADYLKSASNQATPAAWMETDALGNQRVSMERVVAKMPPEMRARYNASRQAGEHFMADGSLTPILAANKAYTHASRKDGGGQQVSADPAQGVTQDGIDQVPQQRLAYLQQWLKNAEASSKEDALGLLEHIKKTSPAEYAALTRPLENRSIPVEKPPKRGMASFREEVNKVGLIPMAAKGMASHVKEATEDPRFPGWL
jgi:hypothetical protein